MRPVLVGEAPCRRRNRAALDGPAGDRLARMVGMNRAELLERFDAVNLVGRWPGAQGKGAAWSWQGARRAAARRPLRGVVVLLGGRVARAYGLDGLGWWTWVRGPRYVAVVISHPSGVNQLYNSPVAREAAGRALRGALALAARVGCVKATEERCGMARLEDGMPGAVALEIVHRYGAVVTTLAASVMDVAEGAPPEVAAALGAAVRDARFQLTALVDGVESAAREAARGA
jgi:hypothetical protein